MTNDTYAIIDGSATTLRTYNIEDRTENGPVYSAVSPNGDVAGRPSLKILQTKSGKGVMKTELREKLPQIDATTGEYPKLRTIYVGALRSDLDDPAEVEADLLAFCLSVADGSIKVDMAHLMAGGR